MKNQWPIWIFVVCVIVVVLFAFNYQGKNSDTVPLSEIFPGQKKAKTPPVEYEFVGQNNADKNQPSEMKAPPTATAAAPQTSAPAQTAAVQPSASAAEVPSASRPAVARKTARRRASTARASRKRRRYSIQVSSFKNRTMAEKALAEVKKAGFSTADIVSKDLGAKGVWYRIYVGNFENKREADVYLKKIKGTYKSSFVISLK